MRTRRRFPAGGAAHRELRFLELGMERLSPARQGGLLASPIRRFGAPLNRLKDSPLPADPVVPDCFGGVP